jgi:CheY-like chemotaxis protein
MIKKIIVVDDDPMIIQLVKAQLEANGYKVFSASTGMEGLEKCKTLNPDAVILDIMLPDMDGGSVAEQLKESPNTRQIPVIFLTGVVMPSEVPESHILGGQYLLPKPFKSQDLLNMLQQVIRKP